MMPWEFCEKLNRTYPKATLQSQQDHGCTFQKNGGSRPSKIEPKYAAPSSKRIAGSLRLLFGNFVSGDDCVGMPGFPACGGSDATSPRRRDRVATWRLPSVSVAAS